ncbi:polyprenyl synthetase family protein [Streptomyces sp. NPDC048295]|uniref:polyprenyl synthetase family protein n=1 Tax=Streptomyces sp. NPDC048295 TaxID=3154617 RepID=UPI00342F8BFF
MTQTYERLLERQDSVAAAVRSALDLLAGSHQSLIAAVRRLLDSDGTVGNTFRLLPFPILGALGADEELAVPLTAFSRIWWTGAEVFDDVADGDFDPASVGLSGTQASIASVACMTLIPEASIEQLALPAVLRSRWLQEFTACQFDAAQGQLGDVSADAGASSWATVMRIYAGKTGAPYGRDAAMAAMLSDATDDAIRGWRVFGRLFGVLRQLANDRASATSTRDEDLANGTRTLLLALALEQAGSRGSEELQMLHSRAVEDVSARRLLRERLVRQDLAEVYNQRVGAIRLTLSELLTELTEPCEHRDLIQWMVNASALEARVPEMAGAA